MAFFFATPEDLLPVLLAVERKHSIVYTPFAHIHEPSVRHFNTARELPTLFRRHATESAVTGPAYLVTEAGTEVVLRKLSPLDGKPRWSVDQLTNPDSTVLRHGGLFKDSVLIQGEVRSTCRSVVAMRLQRAFDSAIRSTFTRIKAYYVGPAAEQLMDTGYRLTSAEQCPPELDLCR